MNNYFSVFQFEIWELVDENLIKNKIFHGKYLCSLNMQQPFVCCLVLVIRVRNKVRSTTSFSEL